MIEQFLITGNFVVDIFLIMVVGCGAIWGARNIFSVFGNFVSLAATIITGFASIGLLAMYAIINWDFMIANSHQMIDTLPWFILIIPILSIIITSIIKVKNNVEKKEKDSLL